MPIYEYRCHACGAVYETLQSISDATIPPCETCGSEQTDRLVSLSSFQLKGSGWYVTDYKGKNGQQPTEKKTDKSDTKTTDSAPKAEAKPTTQAE